jgi:hypothetical protein
MDSGTIGLDFPGLEGCGKWRNTIAMIVQAHFILLQ